MGGPIALFAERRAGSGGGGTSDHSALSNLGWTASGHTGTANYVPYFGSGGAAAMSANFSYSEASGPRLTVGSSGTSEGLILGYSGTSGIGGICGSSLGFSTGGITFANATDSVVISGVGGGEVVLRSSSTEKFRIKTTNGASALFTAGVATTDVNGIALTMGMNAAAVNFTGIKATFTEGASGTGASTLLFNLLYGTSGAEATKFSVSKAGQVLVTDGSQSVPSYAFINATSLGFYQRSNVAITVAVPAGRDAIDIQGTSFALPSDSRVVFAATATATGSPDTGISRVSAGVMGLGTGAQGSVAGTLSLSTIELGNASDTTLSRSAAGVLAVEGVVIPSISSTNTLTNKRVTPRLTSQTGNSPTWNSNNCDVLDVTSVTGAINVDTNLTRGTHSEGDKLTICLTANGAYAITFGTFFESSTTTQGTLPTTTVNGKLIIGLLYNAATSKFRCVGSA